MRQLLRAIPQHGWGPLRKSLRHLWCHRCASRRFLCLGRRSAKWLVRWRERPAFGLSFTLFIALLVQMCEIFAVHWERPTPFSTVMPWARKVEYYGLGNFGWGVAWLEGGQVQHYRYEGRLSEDENADRALAEVSSTHYLVHFRRPNRLSTVQLADTQPFLSDDGRFAFCHNGSFTGEAEFRGRFAGRLEGKADSEVGFRVFEELLGQGVGPEDALARTYEQLHGTANLGYLGAEGDLVLFNAYPRNLFHRFRVDGAEVAATELHSPDDSLFRLVFPTATDRHVITGAEALAHPEAAR
jgi:predicted glutamine amidotransferase